MPSSASCIMVWIRLLGAEVVLRYEDAGIDENGVGGKHINIILY